MMKLSVWGKNCTHGHEEERPIVQEKEQESSHMKTILESPRSDMEGGGCEDIEVPCGCGFSKKGSDGTPLARKGTPGPPMPGETPWGDSHWRMAEKEKGRGTSGR